MSEIPDNNIERLTSFLNFLFKDYEKYLLNQNLEDLAIE